MYVLNSWRTTSTTDKQFLQVWAVRHDEHEDYPSCEPESLVHIHVVRTQDETW
jgi:hypothetical protein